MLGTESAPYLDTSVVVAYYLPEPLSARAQAIYDVAADPAISDHVELELYSACRAGRSPA